MDFQSYVLSKRHTSNEIVKVNQTINSITTGIKTISNVGSQLIFTLNDDSTINVLVTGLSDENFTEILKDKLNSLDDNILTKFTYVDNQLLFNGQPLEGTLTTEQLNNINTIETKGDGSKILADNGSYIEIPNVSSVIDGGVF